MSRALPALWNQIDAELRGESPPRFNAKHLALLLCIATLCGMIYGAVMGTFTGLPVDRRMQLIYSAVKVPILLLVTFAISLPSFFVVNTLLGLRSDFAAAIGALASAQLGVAIALLSLAPITCVWYLSTSDYHGAILFNALIFALAAVAGQIILRRRYAVLIQSDPRHRLVLRGWLIAYAFVGIQMGYVLRPFIGDPGQPVRFFRDEAWGNAYVVVSNMAWELAMRFLHR